MFILTGHINGLARQNIELLNVTSGGMVRIITTML